MTAASDTTDNPGDPSRLAGFLKDALRNLARPEEKNPFSSLAEMLVRHFPGLDLIVCAKRIPTSDQIEIFYSSGPSPPYTEDFLPPAFQPPFKRRLEEAFRHETPLYWKIDSGNAGKEFSGWPESLNLSFFALFPFHPGSPEGDFFLLLGSRSSGGFFATDNRIPPLIIHLASLFLVSMASFPPRSDQEQERPEASEMLFGLTESLALLDALSDPAFLCNTDGTILGVNRAFRRAMGSEETVWTGQDWGTLLPPAIRKEWKRFLKNLPEQEEVFLKDITLPSPRRGGHMVRLSVSMWKNASGRNALLGSFSDISVQIRLEKHLKASEERYRRMFQFAPDGLFLADPETFLILEGNPIFADMTGDHFQELLREQSMLPLWDTNEKELRNLVDRLRHSGSSIQNLYRKLRRKDGTFLHTSANLTLIPATGEKEMLLVQIRDVTGQTEMEGINRIFATIDRMLLAGSPVDALLDVILQGLQDLFPFFSTQFFAPNPDGSIRLVRSASRSEEYLTVSRELVSSLRWNAEEAEKTSIGMALKSRRTRMMISETTDPPLRMILRNFGIRSTLSVPILREDPLLPWGTLTLTRTSEEPFSAELLSVLEKIASKIFLAFARHQELSQIRLQKTAMESIPTPMAITDSLGRIEWANRAYLREKGEGIPHLNGSVPDILSRSGERRELSERIWSTVETGAFFSEEITYPEAEKPSRIIETLVTPLREENGVIRHLIIIENDVSEKKRLENSLKTQAWSDPLTGLPNRTHLALLMEDAIRRSRLSGKAMAVCFLDLDNFKPVNDRMGHAFGDQILVELSRRLLHTVRNQDTVARLGGDEFVLLMEEIGPETPPESLVARILESIAQPFGEGPGGIFLTASIGVTVYPDDPVPADVLLRHADHALYLAKESGRNRFIFFRSDSPDSLGDFESAFASPPEDRADESDLAFDPEADLSTGQLSLLALRHLSEESGEGDDPAGNYPPISDRWHRTLEKSRFMIRFGLQTLSRLSANGSSLKISVPVDAPLLTDPRFLPGMENLLREIPLPGPDRFGLDLRSTLFLEKRNDLNNLLSRYREMGLFLCLDDCTERSLHQMDQIRSWPVNRIRLHPSLTRQISDKAEALVIFHSMVHLAQVLGMDTVVAGVTDRETLRLMTRSGIRFIQGPIISPPLSPDTLAAYLSDFLFPPPSPGSPDVLPDLQLLLGTMDLQRGIRRLLEMLDGGRPFPYPMELVNDPGSCRLGRWLDSSETDHLAELPLFRETLQVHLRAHTLTARILHLHAEGKVEEARSLIPEILACQDQIVENLRALPPCSR